jgi:hypothetical protein
VELHRGNIPAQGLIEMSISKAAILCLFTSGLMLIAGSAVFAAPVCEQAKTIPVSNGRSGFEIDKTWAGAVAAFDSISRGGKAYFGYYNADRWLSIAQLDLKTHEVCRLQLKSMFKGWDAHNIITLAFDQAGRIQIAGNMHASPLVYASATTPDSLSGITLRPMIGKDENQVTYPNFVNVTGGKLLFIYRVGEAGNGQWIVNISDGGKWRRLLNSPIFTSQWRGRPTSAYPSPIGTTQDGCVYQAIVWRRPPDVSANYAITYARTCDFVHWIDHLDQPIHLPIDPGNADMIEYTGEEKGLVNWQRISLAPGGTPVIAYTRYGDDGHNIVILASPDGTGWRRSIVAKASRQTIITGEGTLPTARFFDSPVFDNKGRGSINVTFPGESAKRVYFDAKTLAIVDAPSPMPAKTPTPTRLSISIPTDLVDGQMMVHSVRVGDVSAGNRSVGAIYYFGQGFNRDQARPCTTQQPKACNPPPAPLIFVPSSQN